MEKDCQLVLQKVKKIQNKLDRGMKMWYNAPVMKNQTPYKHRVIIRGNTGTRVMKSKKDKMNSRQSMKLRLRKGED